MWYGQQDLLQSSLRLSLYKWVNFLLRRNHGVRFVPLWSLGTVSLWHCDKLSREHFKKLPTFGAFDGGREVDPLSPSLFEEFITESAEGSVGRGGCGIARGLVGTDLPGKNPPVFCSNISDMELIKATQ